jgi:hypothetical protein
MCGCSGGVRNPGLLGEVAQAAGGGVPVHPLAAGVEQDRSGGPVADGRVDRAADRWRQRDEDGLVALAQDAQDAVTVLLTLWGSRTLHTWSELRSTRPAAVR